MNVLITGGCGYTGSVLTNQLVDQGHKVTVIDTQWFGNHLTENKNLEIIKADIRETEKIPLKNIETIIHLANIANDPGVELNPTLSWEVNVLATQQLADKANRANVKPIIPPIMPATNINFHLDFIKATHSFAFITNSFNEISSLSIFEMFI